MGNSSANRPNLLARNWIRVNNLTYRNVTTNELIDECRIQYQTDEQLSSGSALLMKRANINHPNIVKLIYFCQDNAKSSCRGSVYTHRLYVQHCPFNLRDLIKPNTLTKIKTECLCCPTINGLFFLAQKYGFFAVNQQMILVNERQWPNSTRKRSIKVWMNSELSRSECETVCNEQKMCQTIAIIYRNMLEHQLCSNPRIRELAKFRTLAEQLNFLLEVHQLNPQLNKNPSAVGKLCHQSQFVGSRFQSKEPLIRASNRSYSTYVKEEGMGTARRDNSIVPQVTFANSNKKIVPANSEMVFKNIPRPPSPSVKINFLFANSNQQNSNLQKGLQPNTNLTQISTPSIMPNISIGGNIQPIVKKEAATVKYEQKIQKVVQATTQNKETAKANEAKNIGQEKILNQSSLSPQSHPSKLPPQSHPTNLPPRPTSSNIPPQPPSSNMVKQPQKQVCPPPQQIIQNKPPAKAAAISVKQQLRNEFKNVFQDEPTQQQVSEFTHQDQKQTIQPKHSKKASGQIKKASTSSNNHSSRLQKEEANRQEPYHTHHNNKFNSNQLYPNDSREESDSDRRQISDQDNSIFYRQSQARAPKGKQVNTSVLQSIPGSSEYSVEHQQSNLIDSKEVRKNRKKRQKMQLEKDLQHEKDVIKKQMAMLLKSNMMSDQTNRIKEKVNNKKATFAELKAEASKILGGFGF